MPKNNRDYLKRYGDIVIGNIDTALAYLMLIRNVYAGGPTPTEGQDVMPEKLIEPVEGRDYPEYRQAVEQVAYIITQAHDLMVLFRNEVM